MEYKGNVESFRCHFCPKLEKFGQIVGKRLQRILVTDEIEAFGKAPSPRQFETQW